MRWHWLLAALPAILGVAAAVLTGAGSLPNPLLYVRTDLGIAAMLAGVLVSLAAGGSLALLQYAAHRCEPRVAQAHSEALEDRRRFLRRLDHELKNPLMAIRAGLVNLADPSAEGRREALASIEAQTMRLSRLTTDLRKLADLETRPLEQFPVDLAELLQAALASAQELAGPDGRHIALVLPKAPWPIPYVLGDRDLLFLAVYNLLDNACKFTKASDTIEVRVVDDGNTIVIQVADTGCGIPEEDLPHVWEELYRGRGARGVPGSGLGLALVRAIVERHGGTVSLRSRTGQGTVATLRLPLRRDDGLGEMQ